MHTLVACCVDTVWRNVISSDGLLNTFLDSINEASQLQEQRIVIQRFLFVQKMPPYTVCLVRKYIQASRPKPLAKPGDLQAHTAYNHE